MTPKTALYASLRLRGRLASRLHRGGRSRPSAGQITSPVPSGYGPIGTMFGHTSKWLRWASATPPEPRRLAGSRRDESYRGTVELGRPPPGDDMTWSKYGSEFWDECANAGLSDAAARTHAEAIGWIYHVEQTELTIARHLLRRFAGSPAWESAVVELVSVGFWRDRGDTYEITHHADVIRASIAAQQVKRDRDKRASRAYRKRVSADVSTDDVTDASADVIVDADRQTDNQSGREDLGMPENETSWNEAEVPATPISTGPCVVCGQERAYRIAGKCRDCHFTPERGLRAVRKPA